MKIEIGKKYKAVCVNGEVCQSSILTTTRKNGDGLNVVALIHNNYGDTIYCFSSSGETSFSGIKLVEVTPWDDLKIDDLVLVSSQKPEGEYIRRFAGVDGEDNPTVFMDGESSKSKYPITNTWTYIVPYKKP